ncbi:MAG: nascent polypeptide-associated complex protein [Candidatus Marsarchaeota archaeon]|jgi:nascent polypeptide-associated complex subunit alpha|nr:nascent polypeptide-associated complex protein [Candidatus Marsarchaeota archaeon]MCL5418501.1 nascent polypeptide-associated complex protein [Candidatus Marsarchaeota archaeon]
MMPNLDPRAMKNLMSKMGIKTTEMSASRVVIELDDKDIIIESPQVTAIDAQGVRTFQISGDISEVEKQTSVEITEDDINMVADKTGIADKERIKEALEKTKGDIAEAILLLQGS